MPVASAMWASYGVGGYVYILCWLLYHACEPRASVIKDAEVWSRSTPNSSKPPERMRGPTMILWLRDSGTRTHTTYNYIFFPLHFGAIDSQLGTSRAYSLNVGVVVGSVPFLQRVALSPPEDVAG